MDFPKGSGKSSHENKRALSRFYQKIFLIGNEFKSPYGYLTFIFYQKYFL